jgi:hypothetical protein
MEDEKKTCKTILKDKQKTRRDLGSPLKMDTSFIKV